MFNRYRQCGIGFEQTDVLCTTASKMYDIKTTCEKYRDHRGRKIMNANNDYFFGVNNYAERKE